MPLSTDLLNEENYSWLGTYPGIASFLRETTLNQTQFYLLNEYLHVNLIDGVADFVYKNQLDKPLSEFSQEQAGMILTLNAILMEIIARNRGIRSERTAAFKSTDTILILDKAGPLVANAEQDIRHSYRVLMDLISQENFLRDKLARVGQVNPSIVQNAYDFVYTVISHWVNNHAKNYSLADFDKYTSHFIDRSQVRPIATTWRKQRPDETQTQPASAQLRIEALMSNIRENMVLIFDDFSSRLADISIDHRRLAPSIAESFDNHHFEPFFSDSVAYAAELYRLLLKHEQLLLKYRDSLCHSNRYVSYYDFVLGDYRITPLHSASDLSWAYAQLRAFRPEQENAYLNYLFGSRLHETDRKRILKLRNEARGLLCLLSMSKNHLTKLRLDRQAESSLIKQTLQAIASIEEKIECLNRDCVFKYLRINNYMREVHKVTDDKRSSNHRIKRYLLLLELTTANTDLFRENDRLRDPQYPWNTSYGQFVGVDLERIKQLTGYTCTLNKEFPLLIFSTRQLLYSDGWIMAQTSRATITDTAVTRQAIAQP